MLQRYYLLCLELNRSFQSCYLIVQIIMSNSNIFYIITWCIYQGKLYQVATSDSWLHTLTTEYTVVTPNNFLPLRVEPFVIQYNQTA